MRLSICSFLVPLKYVLLGYGRIAFVFATQMKPTTLNRLQYQHVVLAMHIVHILHYYRLSNILNPVSLPKSTKSRRKAMQRNKRKKNSSTENGFIELKKKNFFPQNNDEIFIDMFTQKTKYSMHMFIVPSIYFFRGFFSLALYSSPNLDALKCLGFFFVQRFFLVDEVFFPDFTIKHP